METINLVAETNKMFRAISRATLALPENYCEECRVEMVHIENDGYLKPGPDRDCEPDFIIERKLYKCPECGHEEWISF
jgi:uncharacterized protein with PIN domain